jgi:MoaA/NifB/PqqE/SkfB family radical SAM enzyme
MEITNLEPEKRKLLKDKKPYVYDKVLKFTDKLKNGESIAIIQFQYNYACNFKCEHCSISKFQIKPKDKRSFTLEDVKKLSKEADELGLARFVITGGEPLIFKDFDALVEAIDPNKFYINVDTNGWFLNDEKAKHLFDIGVDRIQLSIDSLDPKEHDDFRRAPGSHERAMKSIDSALNAGLEIFIQTVVIRSRLYSQEFEDFVKYFNDRGITVFITYAKPVGAWEGHYEELVTMEDINYVRELEKTKNLCTHLTPAYGRDLGCIAVKGMISVTQYGDVLPCPYIHTSIGNVFEEPLKDVIQKGLDIKFFGEYADTCWIAEDMPFIKKYVEGKIYNKPLPVPYEEVFTEEDKTKVPFNKTMIEDGKI